MDRRKMKGHRRGLHQNLINPPTSSQGSTDGDDIFLIPPLAHSSQKSSQRESSIQLLRRISKQSPIKKLDDISKSNSDLDKIPSQKNSQKESSTALLRRLAKGTSSEKLSETASSNSDIEKSFSSKKNLQESKGPQTLRKLKKLSSSKGYQEITSSNSDFEKSNPFKKNSQRISSSELHGRLNKPSNSKKNPDPTNSNSDIENDFSSAKPSQRESSAQLFRKSKKSFSPDRHNQHQDNLNSDIEEGSPQNNLQRTSSSDILHRMKKLSSSKKNLNATNSDMEVDDDFLTVKPSKKKSGAQLLQKSNKPSSPEINNQELDSSNSDNEESSPNKGLQRTSSSDILRRMKKPSSKKNPNATSSSMEVDDDFLSVKPAQKKSSAQLLRKAKKPSSPERNNQELGNLNSDDDESFPEKNIQQTSSPEILSRLKKPSSSKKNPSATSSSMEIDDDFLSVKPAQKKSSAQLLRKSKKPSSPERNNQELDNLNNDDDESFPEKNLQRTSSPEILSRLKKPSSSKKNPNATSLNRDVEKPSQRESKNPTFPKRHQDMNASNTFIDSTPAKRRKIQQNKDDSIEESIERCQISSPKRSLVSKKKSPVNQNHTRMDDIDSDTENSMLVEFFRKSGIKLSEENDQQYAIDNDPQTIIKHMKDLLGSGNFPKDDIIKEYKRSLNNVQNIQKLLNPTIIDNELRLLSSLCSASVVKIMLQVPLLQTQVLDIMIEKLAEAVLVSDSGEDVPWACLFLQQLRFLVLFGDCGKLTIKLEELLEASPTWFQRELINILPDIVTDNQHQTLADILCRLMEQNGELTNVILDCMSNLSLDKEYYEEIRINVLRILESNQCKISNISTMIKFCMSECLEVNNCQKILRVLRELEMQPLPGENSEEYYTSQILTMNVLKMSIILSKPMSNAALTVVSEISENSPKSFDLVMMLLLCDKTSTKKKAEAIMKKHVKCGYYRPSLLASFYQDYKEVAKDLQDIALYQSSILMKSDDCTLVDFSVEWFRAQMILHAELPHKQREVIGKILLLMGKNDQTANNALKFLRKMTETTEETSYLQTHSNHLKILVEKIDKFNIEEVTTINDLLHALLQNSDTASDGLQADLFILIQKQLANTDSLIKRKGVVGAVMAIKHLAKSEKSCKVAIEIFDKVESHTKECIRSQVLFYDKIGQVITSEIKSFNREFLKTITDKFEEEFINTCMTDTESYRGDLVPKCGLNDSQSESQNYLVLFSDTKHGAIVPALFRLMKICYMNTNENQSIDDINALLGCRILLPKDLYAPDSRTLDIIFHCINWYRELISAFVTQKDELLKKQVVQRLENLMQLQGELCMALVMAEPRYQPPLCYFHKFDPTPFNRVEKKNGKKGRKRSSNDKDTTSKENVTDKTNAVSSNLPEWEFWEMGSLLSIKNPMYFRRLDATIAHLLDTENHSGITKSHVCFIVKELLSIFADEATSNETFVRDLIKLLPTICAQLNHLVKEFHSEEVVSEDNKQTIKLLLSLLETIFNWKGFCSPNYNTILRDGLRTLASQIDESNKNLRSSRELVAAAYTYFENMSEIATQISLAYALVSMCKTLMKHSDSFSRNNKDKQSKMAYGFLCLEWSNDRHAGSLYTTAVTGLLKNWMDHEPDPLDSVSNVLDWLPEEVESLNKPHDSLGSLRTINRSNFHNLFQKLFDGTINGSKISLAATKTDAEKLEVWRQVGMNLQRLIAVCKKIATKNVLAVYLRYMPILLKHFIAAGMPVLENDLRYETEEVTKIIKMIQSGTKYLNLVCCHSTEKKDMTLAKLVPAAKSIVEQLLYRVKGMLVMNNSSTAFWMGNLVNKNLDGEEIHSQMSNTTNEPSIPDLSNENTNDASISDGEESMVLGDGDNDEDSSED